jgi:hypothetical protein
LFRPNSEHERSVTDFIRDFHRVTGRELSPISVDTREGAQQAELYGVIRYPAVVAVRKDGELIQLWQDEMLPTINEVSGYLDH